MLSTFKSLTCPRQDLAISHELNAYADGWSVVIASNLIFTNLPDLLRRFAIRS